MESVSKPLTKDREASKEYPHRAMGWRPDKDNQPQAEGREGRTIQEGNDVVDEDVEVSTGDATSYSPIDVTGPEDRAPKREAMSGARQG